MKKKADEGFINTDDVAKMAADTKYDYAFAKDEEGWVPADAGKEYDKAGWADTQGNGVIQLDGSDLGKMDLKPNAYIYKKIQLPKGKVALSFDIRSKSANHDGDFQIEIIQEDGSITTLAPWETIKSESWQKKSVDLSAPSGEGALRLWQKAEKEQDS